MKKTLIITSLLLLAGCAVATGAGNGITRLDSEPKNCEYLYTLDSSSATYNISDAYDYLEKTILEQKRVGDSYYISNQNTLENAGAIFGPKKTYKFKAKVYSCNK
jgi:hypothetical protein